MRAPRGFPRISGSVTASSAIRCQRSPPSPTRTSSSFPTTSREWMRPSTEIRMGSRFGANEEEARESRPADPEGRVRRAHLPPGLVGWEPALAEDRVASPGRRERRLGRRAAADERRDRAVGRNRLPAVPDERLPRHPGCVGDHRVAGVEPLVERDRRDLQDPQPVGDAGRPVAAGKRLQVARDDIGAFRRRGRVAERALTPNLLVVVLVDAAVVDVGEEDRQLEQPARRGLLDRRVRLVVSIGNGRAEHADVEVGEQDHRDDRAESELRHAPGLRPFQPSVDRDGDEPRDRQAGDRHQPLRDTRVAQRREGVPERGVERVVCSQREQDRHERRRSRGSLRARPVCARTSRTRPAIATSGVSQPRKTNASASPRMCRVEQVEPGRRVDVDLAQRAPARVDRAVDHRQLDQQAGEDRRHASPTDASITARRSRVRQSA